MFVYISEYPGTSELAEKSYNNASVVNMPETVTEANSSSQQVKGAGEEAVASECKVGQKDLKLEKNVKTKRLGRRSNRNRGDFQNDPATLQQELEASKPSRRSTRTKTRQKQSADRDSSAADAVAVATAVKAKTVGRAARTRVGVSKTEKLSENKAHYGLKKSEENQTKEGPSIKRRKISEMAKKEQELDLESTTNVKADRWTGKVTAKTNEKIMSLESESTSSGKAGEKDCESESNNNSSREPSKASTSINRRSSARTSRRKTALDVEETRDLSRRISRRSTAKQTEISNSSQKGEKSSSMAGRSKILPKKQDESTTLNQDCGGKSKRKYEKKQFLAGQEDESSSLQETELKSRLPRKKASLPKEEATNSSQSTGMLNRTRTRTSLQNQNDKVGSSKEYHQLDSSPRKATTLLKQKEATPTPANGEKPSRASGRKNMASHGEESISSQGAEQSGRSSRRKMSLPKKEDPVSFNLSSGEMTSRRVSRKNPVAAQKKRVEQPARSTRSKTAKRVEPAQKTAMQSESLSTTNLSPTMPELRKHQTEKGCEGITEENEISFSQVKGRGRPPKRQAKQITQDVSIVFKNMLWHGHYQVVAVRF